ncbi:MAG TPA: VOC family protein, partial [Cytophagales bacterium]|nr:VOC family protein [Cytophagales bacterium]
RQWQLTLPASSPEVEVVPFLIDWSESEQHPSQGMPEMGCSVTFIAATHPQPEVLESVLQALPVPMTVNQGAEVNLEALVHCPNGTVKL